MEKFTHYVSKTVTRSTWFQTSDQRFLVFHERLEEEDSETDSIEAVELAKILEVTPVLDDKKQCITMSLRIKSTDDVQLAAPPEPSRNYIYLNTKILNFYVFVNSNFIFRETICSVFDSTSTRNCHDFKQQERRILRKMTRICPELAITNYDHAKYQPIFKIRYSFPFNGVIIRNLFVT